MGTTQSQRLFLKWLKQNDPFLYAAAVKGYEMRKQREARVMGLGIDWGSIGGGIKDMFGGVVNSLKNLAPTYLQYKQQKKVIDMQMKRAEQGLPPAQVEDYAPVVKVAPTITPQTEAAITRVAQQSVRQASTDMGAMLQKSLPYIAIGGLGLILLFRRK